MSTSTISTTSSSTKIQDEAITTYLLSTSKVISDAENMSDVVSVEHLNSVHVPGTPSRDLHLKIGALGSFIRNIDFKISAVTSGLVNGEKGIVRGVSPRVVDVEVLSEESHIVKKPTHMFRISSWSPWYCFPPISILCAFYSTL